MSSQQAGAGGKPKSKTISLSKVVQSWADEMCALRGFDNFSAYVADLIRRDKEREQEKALALARLGDRAEFRVMAEKAGPPSQDQPPPAEQQVYPPPDANSKKRRKRG
jgi:Arc/MetJ-type ribon-helix-helix transcriptional regulator